MNSQKIKIVRLIFYIAIMVVFLIIRFTYRNSKADENYTFQDIISNKEITVNQENFVHNQILDYTSKKSTDLFTELTENETFGDETIITFKLMNGDILYDMELPLGVFDEMLEEYQLFFNSIVVDAPITEVTIKENSIQSSKENLSYEIETDMNIKISVNIDLHTFEYSFKIL